jgi:hypothetical protein
LQKLINILYRFPKSKLNTYRRFGGYLSYKKILTGNKQMMKAIRNLPIANSYPDGLPIYFLTGEKYIHQTLFCIFSLLKVSDERYNFVLVDDGSITNNIEQLILSKLRDATIVTASQINTNIQKILPVEQYPVINYKRKIYPHLKKLTDIHTIEPLGWKLVLDSDMLFWYTPQELIDWLKNPMQPMYMLDCEESYGYSRKLMSKLCECNLPSLLNVGVIGLKSTSINWDKVENWIRLLEKQEGASYYLEQALTAMLIGEKATTVLCNNAYKVNPTFYDLEARANILHHYVDLSKTVYFEKAWQLI